MLDQTQYVSVERNDWQAVDHEQQVNKANQNVKQAERRQVAKQAPPAGNVKQRAIILAQILFPAGRVHIHHGTFDGHMKCFSPSVYWRFPERKE